MSLDWEKATLVAATKEITGSICKIYAEAALELHPMSFGTYSDPGRDGPSPPNHITGSVTVNSTSSAAVTVPIGITFDGPICMVKTDAISVVYHNGPLIIK